MVTSELEHNNRENEIYFELLSASQENLFSIDLFDKISVAYGRVEHFQIMCYTCLIVSNPLKSFKNYPLNMLFDKYSISSKYFYFNL